MTRRSFQVWIFLLCAYQLFSHATAENKDQKVIPAESGGNVTLPCQAPDKGISVIVVEWSRADIEDEYVLSYRDGQFDPEDQHPSFKNRVDLQDRQMKDGDVSLILNNVTINDTGTYECRVVQRRTSRRKRAHLKTDPISIITLSVVDPPGQTGGLTEDGGKEDEFVGLKVGLLVSALLLVTALVGFLMYRKRQQRNYPNEL
ncbi:programmed cell death 1 ligand 1 [Maylandia zebra]|uniref:programmed cell death 1 ligand 1 n=1 Tax=Maylandia zebra TaxID=106582 RepID=UPI00403C87B8